MYLFERMITRRAIPKTKSVRGKDLFAILAPATEIGAAPSREKLGNKECRLDVTFIKLADVGIHGNGHMMMLEKNSDQVAQVIANWLDKALEAAEAAQRSAP